MTKSTLFLMLFGVVLNMTAAEVSSPKQEETGTARERTIYQHYQLPVQFFAHPKIFSQNRLQIRIIQPI